MAAIVKKIKAKAIDYLTYHEEIDNIHSIMETALSVIKAHLFYPGETEIGEFEARKAVETMDVAMVMWTRIEEEAGADQ